MVFGPAPRNPVERPLHPGELSADRKVWVVETPKVDRGTWGAAPTRLGTQWVRQSTQLHSDEFKVTPYSGGHDHQMCS